MLFDSFHFQVPRAACSHRRAIAQRLAAVLHTRNSLAVAPESQWIFSSWSRKNDPFERCVRTYGVAGSLCPLLFAGERASEDGGCGVRTATGARARVER